MINDNLVEIKKVNDLPTLKPDMDKKELFNAIQDSKPLTELVGKEFKILGIMPEFVDVPKNDVSDDETIVTSPFDEDEFVERLRVTLITDIGVYRSFSVTFNNTLTKILNIFGEDYKDYKYKLANKTKGAGKEMKNYYVIKVL